MSETIHKSLILDQQSMTRRAMRLVLSVSLCIHLLLNVFAYYNHDPILKVEMPVLSGITILAVLVSIKMSKHE